MAKKRTPSYSYRKIYEQNYGPIPRDEDGKSYDIHHKDGDHTNNDPSNLVALSLQEHYDIHYSQQDYGACNLIGVRLGMTFDELSELSRKSNLTRVENGTHHLLGGEIQRKRVSDGKHNWQTTEGRVNTMVAVIASHSERVKAGTHNLLGSTNNDKMKAEGKHPLVGSENNRRMVENGTHPTMKRADGTSLASDRVSAGTHNFVGPNAPSQQKWVCQYCGKSGKGKGLFTRWHGEKCSKKL